MSTLLDTVINYRLEAMRVLSLNGLRLEAIGISTSAYITNTFIGIITKFNIYRHSIDTGFKASRITALPYISYDS
jgi:hypothetical protein